MAEQILIVEDDRVLRETLAYNLTRAGYQVAQTGNGLDALHVIRQERQDLLLLDLMLPGLDGFEVCRQVHQEMDIPIIILTARSDEVDKVLGLEIGADDYLTKPFSMRELLARIKAHLRRAGCEREIARATFSTPVGHPLHFDDLLIDLYRREVRISGEVVPLKPKEYELLALLAQHSGQVLSREQLMRIVWKWETSVDSRTVDVHIRWLRCKIEQDPANPKRIVTVRGIGYRFEG